MTEQGRSVLIIDDDEFFREFYRSELSQHDFSVQFAVDGEEGVAKALELKPDIIMLDIILPKKDGFEVLRDLKNNPTTANIPVIITSTLGNNVDIKKFKEMGAINHFNKTSALPKDIALYIKDVLEHGPDQAKLSLETEAEKENLAPTKIPAEELKSIFEASAKEIEKSLVEPLGSTVSLSKLDSSRLSFADLEEKIKAISNSTGTILVCSEIQATKPSLAVLMIKRDDALSLIKLLERGPVGNYSNQTENQQLLESFFNIILTALLNKLSVSLSNTFLSKPPSVISSKDLLEVFLKLNTAKEEVAALVQTEFQIEPNNVLFSFHAFFNEETLVKVTTKPGLKADSTSTGDKR